MATIKRILRVFRFLILAALALAIGAVAVFTLTAKGRENLAGLVSAMASSQESKVRIGGLSGIWAGPLAIDHVVLEDVDGAWLVARGIEIDWSLLPLLSSTFKSDRVFVRRLEVARLPKSKGNSGGSAELPVSLAIKQIDLPEIALGEEIAGAAAQLSAKGSLDALADPLNIETDLQIVRTDGAGGELDASIHFVPSEKQLDIAIRGAEPAGGILASILKLPGAPPVNILVSGSGPADDWKGSGTFAVDGAIVTTVSGSHKFVEGGSRIEVKGDGAFDRFLPEGLRALLAGKVDFDIAGLLATVGGFNVDHANLQSSAIHVNAKGSVDPQGASDFALEASAAAGPVPLSFGAGAQAVTMSLEKASARVFGAGSEPMVDAAASLDRVTMQGNEFHDIEATLHSDGFDVTGRSGPVSIDLKAGRLVVDNPALAPLVTGQIRASAMGAVSDEAIRIDAGLVTSDALMARLSGRISRPDFALSMNIEADAAASALPEAARARLGERVTLSGMISGDVAGTLSANSLKLVSGDLSVEGSASLSGDNIEAALKGAFANVGRLAPGATGAVAFSLDASGKKTGPGFSLKVTSEKLQAAGREITDMELAASGTVDLASPTAKVSLAGRFAGEALAGTADLKTANGHHEINGLSVAFGQNQITGNLVLDENFMPEGSVDFSVPDLGRLAALAQQEAQGEAKGKIHFATKDGTPQIVVNATASSLSRADLAATGVAVDATVADYLGTPTISGKVRAASVASGTIVMNDIDATLSRSQDRLNVAIRGAAPAGGMLANLLGLPGSPKVDLAISGSGPPADWQGSGTVAVDGALLTTLSGTHKFVDGGSRIELKGDGEFARLLPAGLRPLLVGKANFDIAGLLAEGGAVNVERANLQSSSFRVSAKGTVAPKGVSDFALQAEAMAEPVALVFGTGADAVSVTVDTASVRALGPGDAPMVDISAAFGRAAYQDYEATDVVATVHSDGFVIAATTGPLSIDLAAEALSVADTTIAPLVAGKLRVKVDTAIATDAIRVESGSIVGQAIDAALSGSVSRQDYSLSMAVSGNVLSSALPLAGLPLGERVALSGNVGRDAAGTFSVDSLKISSDDLSIEGDVDLAGDTVQAALKGVFANVGRVVEGASGKIAFALDASGTRQAPEVRLTVSSDKIEVAGREVTALGLTASGAVDLANPAAQIAIKGNVGGETLAGSAALTTSQGRREINGLAIELGANRITGNLVLDQKFMPEGTLQLAFPDIGSLAALAFETVEGDLTGTVRLAGNQGAPEVAVDAIVRSLARGDLSVKDIVVNAVVRDYLAAPVASGRVRAASLVSGSAAIDDLDVVLTRDGAWTGFDGGANVSGMPARAAGRLGIEKGTTTIELASASATLSGIAAKLAAPSTVTVRDGSAVLDNLSLDVSGGTIVVTGTAGKGVELDLRLQAVPATILNTFNQGLGAHGAVSGTARIAMPAPGPDGKSTLDGAISLDRFNVGTNEFRGIGANFHSDGFDLASTTGQIALDLSAASTSVENPALAPLVAGPVNASATMTFSEASVAIDTGSFKTDAFAGNIVGSVSRADSSLTLDLTADIASAALPAAARPALGEQVALSATVTRTTEGGISASPVKLVSGDLKVEGSAALSGDTLDANLGGALADVGRLAEGASGAVGFSLNAKGAALAPDLSLTVTSDRIQAAGREITGLELAASGVADLANPAAKVSLKGNVAGEALTGSAELKTIEGRREVNGLSVMLGQNRITGDLVLDESFVPQGAVDFTIPDVGPLAALALDQAKGDLKGKVRFGKTNGVPEIVVDATTASLSRADLAARDVAVAATVSDYLGTPAISGKVRAASVVSGATVISNVDVTLTRNGVWTGFSGGATVNAMPAKAAGRFKIEDGATVIELASGEAAVNGIKVALAKATTIVVKGGEAVLDKITLAIAGGSVVVSGTAGKTLALDVQLNGVPAAVANTFSPGLNASGTVSGSARVSGQAAKPEVGYTINWTGAQTAQTRAAGFGAMTITSNGTFSGGTLKFQANIGDGSGLGLRGGGTVGTRGTPTLSLDFSGRVPFGFLTQRLAAQGLSLSGGADVSLQVRGPATAPAVGGTIRSSGARLVDSRSGIAINDISADVSLGSGVATLRSLTGKLSTGGSLSASGTVGIDAAKGFPANLSLKIVEGRYTDGRIVTATLNGDLTLKGSLISAPLLSGTINLGRTVITIPERLPASLSTLDVRHKNAPKAVIRQQQAIRPAEAGGGGGGGLNLDITINAPQQIFIQGRGLDAELGGSLRLTGASAAPQAAGQFTMRRGRLSLLGRRLTFSRGTLGFSGSLIPYLDLAADSTARDATVTVLVTGPATNPKFSFSSVPTLPEDEVLARLIFGRSMSNLSPLQIAQLADAAAQLAGVGGPTSLLETLRGKLGVDDLDVQTDEEGNAAVSAGKYLNDRTYVTIQKGEKAGSGKATINLDVGRGIKLRGEAADDGEAKGGIFFEREY